MIHKALITVGLLVIVSWPVLYARNEWYWFGLPLGFAVAFAGVVASGGREGGGS